MEIRTFRYQNANNDEEPVIVILDDNEDTVLGVNLHYLVDPIKIINFIAQSSRYTTEDIYPNVVKGDNMLESCVRRYNKDYMREIY